jgi:hypothetical protein
MTEQPFRLSKDSIEIPYRRFLADSSAGFLLILLVGLAYYFPLVTSTSLRHLYGPAGVGREAKVFFCVLAFLLATPIGFAVNAFSWFLLTQPIDGIERYAAHHSGLPGGLFSLTDIAASRQIAVLGDRYGVKDDNFAEQASFLRQALESPALARFAPEMQARGLLIFIRNCTLFLLVMGMMSIGAAGSTNWQLYALAVASAMIVVALLLPWRQRGRLSLVLALVALSLITVAAVFAVADQRLAVQGAIMIVASAGCAVLAGVIGFYNSCLIVLYAYFAEVSVGEEIALPPAAPENLRKITSMIISARKAEMQTERPARID